MTVLENFRRLLDAFLTALAVVFGLIPDPTRRPVPIRVERDRQR